MKYNKDLFIEHLSGMVRIPTVSSADPEKTRVEEFESCTSISRRRIPWYIRPFSARSSASAPCCTSGPARASRASCPC